jgi:2-keto-4-pentenoate hydratase
MKLVPYFSAVAVSVLACSAQAACPPDAEITAIVARYISLEAVPNPSSEMTMEDAACGRDKLVAALKQQYGRHIGYKAALTNPAVQKALNYPNPIRGVLFEKMRADGTELPARFGARPLFEADLVMEVKDTSINQATTHLEALRGISRIYPFIELPDLMVEDPAKLTALSLLFLNAGARHGVLGKPLDVTATPELVESLGNMTVRLSDQEGKVLETGKGSAILGQPLNAVLWLIKELNGSGIALQTGDLLSLGSFSRPQPPKAGMGITVTYEGLPGPPTVSVRFR